MRRLVGVAVVLALAGCSGPIPSGDVPPVGAWGESDAQLATVVAHALGDTQFDAAHPVGRTNNTWDLSRGGIVEVGRHFGGPRFVHVSMNSDAPKEAGWFGRLVTAVNPGVDADFEVTATDSLGTYYVATVKTPAGTSTAASMADHDDHVDLTLTETGDLRGAVQGITMADAKQRALEESLAASTSAYPAVASLPMNPVFFLHGRLAYGVTVAWQESPNSRCADDMRILFVDAEDGAILSAEMVGPGC